MRIASERLPSALVGEDTGRGEDNPPSPAQGRQG
jgi:hypothetical protein